MNMMIDYISDYVVSEHFMLLDSEIKEQAEALLDHFCRSIDDTVNIAAIEKTLDNMARLALPLAVRKVIPRLVAGFFEFLGSTGRIPEAKQWTADVGAIEKNYLTLFRDDGTVRGTTFEKKYTPTGRNDPCPCGSGRKFKKCCGG
jgi:hypothetical protein